MKIDIQALAPSLILGAVAGFLASFVAGPVKWGLIGYIIAGVLGALVGPLIVDAAKVRINLGTALLDRLAVSTIGAIAVIIVAKILA